LCGEKKRKKKKGKGNCATFWRGCKKNSQKRNPATRKTTIPWPVRRRVQKKKKKNQRTNETSREGAGRYFGERGVQLG